MVTAVHLDNAARDALVFRLLEQAKKDFNIDGDPLRDIDWGRDSGYERAHPDFAIGVVEYEIETTEKGFFQKTIEKKKKKKLNFNIKVDTSHSYNRADVYSKDQKYDDACLWLANQLTPYYREVNVVLQNPEKVRAANPNPSPPRVVLDANNRVRSFIDQM